MADKTVRVLLQASASGFLAEMRKASAATSDLSKGMAQASQTQGWKDVSNVIGGIGLALTGIAIGAIKMASDFDSSMSAVAATGSEARAAMDDLRAAALKAGADTKYSATEAAGGIEALLKAGVSVKDVMGGGLTGALNLAASGNLGVAESAEVAATAMTQFGLSGRDVGHIADLLAAGAGKAQGEVSDLAMALKQGGLLAASAGLSIEETTGTLSAFASAGLLGSDAGTSLKTMLQRLQNPSKEAADTMSALGIRTYDASGKFVSMSELAGQLKERLGGLSEEQRNAAMATIFGSDAVRAANILYSQGSVGIDEWTKAVNEQGYAAMVAATRMDNLKGDLEELGGSFETLAIQAGSGSQGALRSIVQSLTDLTNWAGQNQGAAQAIVAIAGGLGAVMLTTAGVMKAVTAVSEFKAALTALAPAGSTANATLKGLAINAAKAAVAFAALKAAQASWQERADQQQTTTNDILASSAKTQVNLDQMLARTSTVYGSIGTGVTGLADGFKQLDYAQSSFVGGFVSGAADMVYGAGSNYNMIRQQLAELDKAMTTLAQNNRSADAVELFNRVVKESGRTAEEVAPRFRQYQAVLEEQARALGVTTLSNADYAAWMGGKVPDAINKAAQAQGKLIPATDRQAEAAQRAAKANADMAKEILDAADAAIAASGSQIALEAAIDDAAASVKENGKNLDINTEKGRANQAALDAIASSALRVVDAQKANNASASEVAATTQRARDAFIASAVAMGMGADKAAALADRYGLIPKVVETDVRAKLDAGSVSAAEQALANLARNRRAVISVTASGASAIKNQLSAIAEADGGIVRYASGGLRERHVAQIAKAGTWRVWAEDETGGESYIPLHPSKRTRSLDIWRQTGRLLGVQGFAEGGFYRPQLAPVAGATTYSFGDITISASDLDGVRSVEAFVAMLRPKMRMAGAPA